MRYALFTNPRGPRLLRRRVSLTPTSARGYVTWSCQVPGGRVLRDDDLAVLLLRLSGVDGFERFTDDS